MSWLIYPFLAIFFFALSDICIKLSSGKINDAFGGFLLNFISSLPLIIFMIYFSSQGQKVLETKPGGIIYSILGGLLIGTGTIFIYKMFSSGANLSVGFPVFRVGLITLSAFLGFIVLKEPINLKYLIGLILSLSGIFLIVTSK